MRTPVSPTHHHVRVAFFLHFYRYIVTNRGMHAMYEKYRTASFGRCPHVFCQGQPVLPVGLSDLPRNYTVNVFCPRCHGLFFPKSTRQANIDGAYFGTTFPHLYLMTHPVRVIICRPPFRCFTRSTVVAHPHFSLQFPGYDPSQAWSELYPSCVWLQDSHFQFILQEPR
jgi:hypothetical protein